MDTFFLAGNWFTSAEVDAIVRAFCAYSGAKRRWQALAEHGATDADLLQMIEREMGDGGSSGPDPVVSEWHSSSPPRIWLHRLSWADDKPPTFQGTELLLVLRQLFGIGQPVPTGQLRLIELKEAI